jgi:hypothetical protein
MNSYTFNNLVGSPQESRFDSDKVDAIKTTVQAAGCVSADQMVELLEFISFHDSKLEVTKAGTRYTQGGNTVLLYFKVRQSKDVQGMLF